MNINLECFWANWKLGLLWFNIPKKLFGEEIYLKDGIGYFLVYFALF